MRYNNNSGFIQPTKRFTWNCPDITAHLHHMFVPENEFSLVQNLKPYWNEVGNAGLVVAKIACVVDISVVKEDVANVVFVVVKIDCVVNSLSVTADVTANVVFVVEKTALQT